MKILLMGDASNYHHTLSVALTRAGHDVTVASNGSRWMRTGRDIDLSRRDNKVGGLILWLRLNTLLASMLKGYDVVQIHNPIFIDQKPVRVHKMFDRLRADNGGVFLSALGTDTQYIEMCTGDSCPLRYSEWVAGGTPTPYALANADKRHQWLSDPLLSHSRYVYDNIDGAVSALYEYHKSIELQLPADKIAYGGIPVEIPEHADCVADGPLRVMVACHKGREAEKGVDVLLPVLKKAEQMSAGALKLDFVQNVPFDEFKRTLDAAHVVVDQLYSYTPATTALMAMARGKVVVSGGEPEYYEFIGEDVMHPIVNADPANPEKLIDQLLSLANNRDAYCRLSVQSRDFAIKHNSVDVVAKRFVEFWERRLR